MFKFHNLVAKEVYLRLIEDQRRKEVSGSMEKAPMKYSSLKEVSLVTLVLCFSKMKISLKDRLAFLESV